MGLETQLQLKKRIVRRYPSAETLAQVEKGNKFIVVEEDFELSYVPQGYTLIDMNHKGDSFKTLVPQSLLFFMANSGEGDPESALEEIADFYGEAEDFEDEIIENGQTNVQEANWATLARNSYSTYLVNNLVKNKKWERDEEGEPVPEFNQEVLKHLGLYDEFISNRAKAIAAIALNKTIEEVKEYGVGDVLKHVTVKERGEKQKLTKQELEKVACYCGSHWELKDEYMNNPDVEYQVGISSGTKQVKLKRIPVFDSKINDLEEEITSYRLNKYNPSFNSMGRHDNALIRQYINLAYISPENPRAQLDIKPPEKIGVEEKK